MTSGRDASSREDDRSGFAPEGFDAAAWRALTAAPRRYGFYAALKTPFRLAERTSRVADPTFVADALTSFAQKPDDEFLADERFPLAG